MTEPMPMRVVEIPPFTDRERQIQEHYKLNLLRCRHTQLECDFEGADITALAMLLTEKQRAQAQGLQSWDSEPT